MAPMAREEGGVEGGEEVVVAREAMGQDVEARHCPLPQRGNGVAVVGYAGGCGGLSRLGNMDTNALIGSIFLGGMELVGLVDRSSGSCSSLP